MDRKIKLPWWTRWCEGLKDLKKNVYIFLMQVAHFRSFRVTYVLNIYSTHSKYPPIFPITSVWSQNYDCNLKNSVNKILCKTIRCKGTWYNKFSWWWTESLTMTGAHIKQLRVLKDFNITINNLLGHNLIPK
jgi:hypothetical protein